MDEPHSPPPVAERKELMKTERSGLRADCDSCFGLCCVAPSFSASADFAITKEPGRPCPNLQTNFRCAIHAQLRQRGFRGCTVYDCFGAGQKISQHTYGGRDWRAQPSSADEMFAVFPIMRTLHQMLWYLMEVLALELACALHLEVTRVAAQIEQLTHGSPAQLLALDLAVQRATVDDLLRKASELVRAPIGQRKKQRRRSDMIGQKLRGADLRGFDLRGVLLIGADLRAADLRCADLIGADLRAAELHGADLRGCLFLTQSQLNATQGDDTTKFSAPLTRPTHWLG